MKLHAVIHSVVLAILLSTPLFGAEPDAKEIASKQEPQALTLPPLRKECKLERQWVGAVFQLPWGAWLSCNNGEAMLITGPLNLLGKVHIDSSGDALAFVRFFSSPGNYEMFDLDGMVEVTTADDFWGLNLVQETGLEDRFHAPTVSGRSVEGFCYDKNGVFRECTQTEYTIHRFVALYDDNIYKVQETVTEDGFYTLCSKELVVKDLSRFGIMHTPPY